jgi:hypothetical protein
MAEGRDAPAAVQCNMARVLSICTAFGLCDSRAVRRRLWLIRAAVQKQERGAA